MDEYKDYNKYHGRGIYTLLEYIGNSELVLEDCNINYPSNKFRITMYDINNNNSYEFDIETPYLNVVKVPFIYVRGNTPLTYKIEYQDGDNYIEVPIGTKHDIDVKLYIDRDLGDTGPVNRVEHFADILPYRASPPQIFCNTLSNQTISIGIQQHDIQISEDIKAFKITFMYSNQNHRRDCIIFKRDSDGILKILNPDPIIIRRSHTGNILDYNVEYYDGSRYQDMCQYRGDGYLKYKLVFEIMDQYEKY